MPDKPTWAGHLDEAARAFAALPDPWIDRSILESVLRIGPRRAQQILAPCVSRQIGSAGVAHRDAVLERLRQLASGDVRHYERRRQLRLAEYLEEERRAWLARPKVLVEAPVAVMEPAIGGSARGDLDCPGGDHGPVR